MLSILKKISRNKIFYCFLFLILLMFPSSLYHPSDNNTKLVVTTIGIDKDDDSGYNITALAVIPKVSTDVNANLESFEGKGNSISEALHNITLNTGKDIGLAHCDCLILSFDIMQENVATILDYFIRTSNLTTNAALLSTDGKAKDLVEASKNSNNLLDLTLKDIVSYEETATLLENTTIEKFYRQYFSDGGTFILPVISTAKQGKKNVTEESSKDGSADSTQGQKDNQSGGKINNQEKIAVLNKGKFERILSEDENFIYNLLSKTSQYINIEIDDINDQYTTQSIEIYQQVNKIGIPLYKFDNGKPYVEYNIWLNIMLEEVQSSNNFSFASIDSLQNYISDTVKEKLLSTIEDKRFSTVQTMQTEQDDILNLYAKFNAFNHKKWQNYLSSLESKNEYLSNMDIKLNIHLSYVI